MASCPPRLPLRLPFSPLISGIEHSDSLSTRASEDSLLSSSSLSFVLTRACRQPITGPHNDADQPLKPPGIPSKEIIQLLDLLERMGGDIAAEVQRVQHGIRDARTLIRNYKEEREARDARLKARRDGEKRETKGIDDEFWLGV